MLNLPSRLSLKIPSYKQFTSQYGYNQIEKKKKHHISIFNLLHCMDYIGLRTYNDKVSSRDVITLYSVQIMCRYLH